MPRYKFELRDEEATERFGAQLADHLPRPALIGLSGTLGAGKTRLVQAVAAAVGVARREVVSPTFVLCQQYDSSPPIYHLDVYRLRDEDEWYELGVEELLQREAWVFIEWAERFADVLPEARIDLELEITGETARRAILQEHDMALAATLAQWERRWAEDVRKDSGSSRGPGS